jgi:hypothetical protein
MKHLKNSIRYNIGIPLENNKQTNIEVRISEYLVSISK